MAYVATRIVIPLRTSSATSYLPARITANWIGLSTRVSRTFSSPSTPREDRHPGRERDERLLDANQRVERVVLAAQIRLGNQDDTPSSQ